MFGVLLVLFAVAVLLPGFRLAGRLDDVAAALRIVSEQRRQPDVLARALASVRDRLESYGYVDEPLGEIRTGTKEFDDLVATLSGDTARAGAFASSPGRAVQNSAAMRAQLDSLKASWATYRTAIAPIAGFTGVPYADSEAAGVQLNPDGRALAAEARKAIVVARHESPQLVAITGRIAVALEQESARLSTYLRFLMLTALTGVLALGVGLIYFARARRRESERLADAQRQTDDILQTVKDGLFLLDDQARIGATHSASLQKLFKRDKIAGIGFADLLQPIVPEKTLQTALRFVEVLWSERTRENLVKSINPLQEVEVSFDNGTGGHEIRWLEFDFHRVKHDGKQVNLLVSVNDVTQRVRLARELAESREKAQSQVDTLLGVLHVNPQHLRSFLSDSDAAMRMVNAMLREPTREESAFRRKLDSIFRQIHSIKGEAAALGLGTVEARAHEFEDSLKELRERDSLSGGDFLPLVVKLDDLFTHLSSISDLVNRLAQLNFAIAPGAVPPSDEAEFVAGPAERAGADGTLKIESPSDAISETLKQLSERLAQERGKSVRLLADGLGNVPEEYRRVVKDIAIQTVRNSLVHGIEMPDVRKLSAKEAAGKVKVEFRNDGPTGYRLIVEDDGAGLNKRRIREVATERGIVTAEEAARLEAKQLLSLLFRPGFSTAEVTDEDAGRGVGMNLVAELVKQAHGRIAVSSGEGRYTRVTIVLPPLGTAAAGAAAGAAA
jgi:HPt (histidine-containing phosphotransfer) domain-containing protein/PAS domain-containing protein